MDAPRLSVPCVAIHCEETQLERFSVRAQSLLVNNARTRVLTVVSPLVYVQSETHSTDSTALYQQNAALRRAIDREMGQGRIAAHRIYQLDGCCSDPDWIPQSQVFRDECSTQNVVIRVVAHPRQLQSKMTQVLVEHGIQTHPTQYTHELFVTTQASTSPLFFFGIGKRQPITLVDDSLQIRFRSEAPCRAFFKMQESLRHVSLCPGDHVLDVGASPGGWTECLVDNGARVVAVDPGELTIETTNRPIVHLQMLLEDALEQLRDMERFTMCVCDINVRVAQMAALILQAAPLLKPQATAILTLKLGKRPTPQAVDGAFEQVQQILAPAFTDFRLVWLHANTQNERTLFATKR
ncbi:hypothetical protein Poli38472_002970 [Pythium oligandrum]|uniref:Ribosomal RNA methyltransferase FtsJ domain-containing protein n=1 Tax=Pythium oligandrum TaxID=41045 RepID=A0A8K1FB99_PYTOL|nr:hypothetical protein Poli38472_002970 [Pythium oligandrum]|eukprot:TMW57045.1 hypothetical protein Poli38472_002970 [Pythium oligandrum]